MMFLSKGRVQFIIKSFQILINGTSNNPFNISFVSIFDNFKTERDLS